MEITDLPPEVLETILLFLSSDIKTLRSLSLVNTQFQTLATKVPVSVSIPLQAEDLRWLKTSQVPVRSLSNCEIAAYVSDQIFSLNLSRLREARLVGSDYQSRRCEVTSHYLRTVDTVCRRARRSLLSLHLNVDLSKGRRSFRFAEILTQLRSLKSLSIHFSAHIELNQRILQSDDTQLMIDVLLSNLPSLRIFNIYICPPRSLRISSRHLQEVGIYKSDAIQITKLELPSLRKLNIQENVVELFRKILADKETAGRNFHENLLSVIYEGCPNIRTINRVILGPELRTFPRPERKVWTKTVNRLLVRRYKLELEHMSSHLSSHRIL